MKVVWKYLRHCREEVGVYAPMLQMGFFAADGGVSRSPNTVRGARGKVHAQLTSLCMRAHSSESMLRS